MSLPDSFTQELLNRIDVVDVIDKRVQLKKRGANFIACCPFHDEKTPSFTVSPSKQFYHCFGCNASGDAIQFLIEYEGLTFIDAITELSNSIGLKVPNDEITKKEDTSEYSKLEELVKQASHYYQTQLRKSPKAISYLKSRGLTGEIAKEFSIGYAPKEWKNLASIFNKYEDQLLIKAGLTNKNEKGNFYDRFRDRIIFPIYGTKGKVIGFGGRAISSDNEPKYYNSPETPLFQKSYELYGLLEARKAIRDNGYVLVVEGYMDVVSLAQHNIRNVVATLGTATTIFHIKKLMRYTHNIVFCFDGDDAGKSAAWRAMNNSLGAVTDKAELKFLFLPDKHDPDSFIREKSKKEFEFLAKEAIPLTEYIIKFLTIENDLVSQEKKVRFLNQIEPILKEILAPKLSLLFKKRITQLVDLDVSEIDQIISTKINVNKENKTRTQNRIPMTSKKRFCLLLLLCPKLVQPGDSELFLSDHQDDKLIQAVIKVASGEGEHNTATVLRYLAGLFGTELVNQIQQRLIIFDEKMDVKNEIEALRLTISKKNSSQENKIKLNLIKQKSLTSLTDEERDFLKNITKK